MKTVLVVAAHPDDEVLGCGGTIAAHSRNGDQVHVVIVAEGLTSRNPQAAAASREASLATLALCARQAADLLGVASLRMLGLPDNRLDSLDRLDVIQRLEAEVERARPQVVYTHHAGDLNIDHRIVHEAVLTACRPQPSSQVESLLFFEVPSSTGWLPAESAPAFAPNWFVDISACVELKMKALACYGSEVRPWPHARSIKALGHLASWRGASVGLEAAEAFVLGRRLA